MRLTDLVRNEDGEGKGRKSKQSPVPDMPRQGQQDLPETIKPSSGFLQAQDLTNIYDIPNQAPDAAQPAPGVNAPVQGVQYGANQQPLPPVQMQQTSPQPAPQPVPQQVYQPPQPPPDQMQQPLPPPVQQPVQQQAPMPQFAPAPAAQPAPAQAMPPVAQGLSSGQPSRRKRLEASPDSFEIPADNELADTLHIEQLTMLDDIYDDGRDGRDIHLERLIPPLARTIELCRKSNSLLRKAVRLKKGGRSFTSHSLNAAILAIKIGLSRNYNEERLFSLALCAMLGDIGMTRVDPGILNKSGKLTKDEFMEIKRHVDYTVDIVSAQASKFPFLATIVYQIHERENGSGYPRGLKGTNIHDFSKIIGMCDVYIALTEPKANRENYSGYVAMQQIISRRGIDFDSKVIKTLIDVISVFPLESLIRLNNGAIGRVIDISPIHPTRPKLRILIDGDGEKVHRPTFLDLEKEPLLYIEGPDVEEGILL